MDQIQDIIDKINKINMKNCEGVLCGNAMYFVLKERKTQSSATEILSCIKRIVKIAFTNNVSIETKGDGNNLFLFSNSYRDRMDFLDNFENVVKLSSNMTFVKPGNDSIRIRLGYIFLSMKWYYQLKTAVADRAIRMIVISNLIKAYADYLTVLDFCKINKLRIKNLITLCDVHIIDSFFTQMMNRQGIRTFTLQHGVYTTDVNPWALYGSPSQYFLSSNQFTYDEAKLLGFRNKMIVAGMYSYVGREIIKLKRIDIIKTIGVFLDSEVYRNDNIKTIRRIAEYHEKYGKNIKIKFHPNSKIEDYKKYTSIIANVECVDKRTTVIDFCKDIDIVIVRNSTTLIEAIQCGKLALIIHDDDQTDDMFKHVDMLKFTSVEELHSLIDVQNIDCIKKQMESARAYFCIEGDVTENYKKIFGKYGIT